MTEAIGKETGQDTEEGPAEDKDSNMRIDSLEEEIRLLKNQIRSMDYSQSLERDAYKRELSALYDELNIIRREKKNLQKQLDDIMQPPLLVGDVVEDLGNGEVIIRNGTGQSFITTISDSVDRVDISAGVRVGLDKNNLCIIRALSKGKDPIIMGSEVLERPVTSYSEIGGLEGVIGELKESVELPLTHPELFKNIGIKPPSGVMLVGAPGTGKTLIAKAVANSAKCTFIRMVGSELVQKFIGEGGRLVRELFQLAREKRPCIIFIDEIDAIGAKRLGMDTTGDREVQRTLMQLLAEMDGFQPLENIAVMAATNRIDIIDEALIRPGRFDRIVEVPMPDTEARLAILKIHIRDMKLSRSVNLKAIARETESFSGADLRNLCTEAGMFAIRNRHRSVNKEDMRMAMEKLRARMNGSQDSGPAGMFG
ncbi:MAG: proteasome-activating nucleotidase [Candidatus Thermoplasmatota archaeon]|nr:proteasome-activating nucleotidase [Candidatus Thermoplasmatota archaeon]